MRTELATELIRALPKAIRKTFVPAPEYAGRALRWLARSSRPPTGGQESLPQALARALRGLTGERVEPTDDRPGQGPRPPAGDLRDHRRPRRGRGRQGPRPRWPSDSRPRCSRRSPGRPRSTRRTGATDWVFGTIAAHRRAVPGRAPGGRLPGAGRRGQHRRADRGRERRPAAAPTHRRGLRRLVLLQTPDPTKWVIAHLGNTDKLSLGTSPYAERARPAGRRPAGLGGRADPAGRWRATRGTRRRSGGSATPYGSTTPTRCGRSSTWSPRP